MAQRARRGQMPHGEAADAVVVDRAVMTGKKGERRRELVAEQNIPALLGRVAGTLTEIADAEGGVETPIFELDQMAQDALVLRGLAARWPIIEAAAALAEAVTRWHYIENKGYGKGRALAHHWHHPLVQPPDCLACRVNAAHEAYLAAGQPGGGV